LFGANLGTTSAALAISEPGYGGTFTLTSSSCAAVATQGGPNYASNFFMLYLFNNAFSFLNMGYASAMAWVLFVLVLVLTVFQFRMARRWVYYEGDA
jgi:multiple sugar transport system permease protein